MGSITVVYIEVGNKIMRVVYVVLKQLLVLLPSDGHNLVIMWCFYSESYLEDENLQLGVNNIENPLIIILRK